MAMDFSHVEAVARRRARLEAFRLQPRPTPLRGPRHAGTHAEARALPTAYFTRRRDYVAYAVRRSGDLGAAAAAGLAAPLRCAATLVVGTGENALAALGCDDCFARLMRERPGDLGLAGLVFGGLTHLVGLGVGAVGAVAGALVGAGPRRGWAASRRASAEWVGCVTDAYWALLMLMVVAADAAVRGLGGLVGLAVGLGCAAAILLRHRPWDGRLRPGAARAPFGPEPGGGPAPWNGADGARFRGFLEMELPGEIAVPRAAAPAAARHRGPDVGRAPSVGYVPVHAQGRDANTRASLAALTDAADRAVLAAIAAHIDALDRGRADRRLGRARVALADDGGTFAGGAGGHGPPRPWSMRQVIAALWRIAEHHTPAPPAPAPSAAARQLLREALIGALADGVLDDGSDVPVCEGGRVQRLLLALQGTFAEVHIEDYPDRPAAAEYVAHCSRHLRQFATFAAWAEDTWRRAARLYGDAELAVVDADVAALADLQGEAWTLPG